jgi:hypothetical protein
MDRIGTGGRLLITHKLSTHEESEFDIREP